MTSKMKKRQFFRTKRLMEHLDRSQQRGPSENQSQRNKKDKSLKCKEKRINDYTPLPAHPFVLVSPFLSIHFH